MWVPLKVFHQKRSQRASFPLGSVFFILFILWPHVSESQSADNTPSKHTVAPQLFVGPSGSFWVCRTLIFPGETRKRQPEPAEDPGGGPETTKQHLWQKRSFLKQNIRSESHAVAVWSAVLIHLADRVSPLPALKKITPPPQNERVWVRSP